MQVSVENTADLQRRMTITLDDANIQQQVEQRLSALRPNVKIAGFRKGKVPMKMVAQMHGASTKQEIIDKVIQESMQEAFLQEKITPAGRPKLETIDEEGLIFSYVISYEVFPEVNTIELKDISADKVTATVTDDDVTDMITTLREQRAEWEVVERASQTTDRVTIDFVGKIDGEIFEGGEGKEVPVVIGAGAMLPDFESQLTPVVAGQSLTIEVRFPEDYQAENLQGKMAMFDIAVHQVEQKNLPILDDAFAAQCGVQNGLSNLNDEVKNNMVRELDNALKQKNKQAVMEQLAAKNSLLLPEVAVDREAEHLMNQAKNNLQQQGVDIKNIPFTIDSFKDSAKQRVTLSLLIGKIIEDNSIEADDESVKVVIDTIAGSYENADNVVDYYMNDPQKLSEVKMMVVEDKVVDWLYQQIEVNTVNATFSEVMNRNNVA
ncbi:MAG TPA: trigger factor [Gammaproteobacteria bacterium]|nr:trigger factor [Gammaproteobacteria bacterium]